MIKASLDNLESLKIIPDIYELVSILKCMGKLNFTQTEQFNFNGVIVNYISLDTKDEHECKYEAHRKFADVHIIVDGSERIKVAEVDKLLEIEKYSEEKDIAFFSGEEDFCVDLKANDLLFCDTNDAHKVAIFTGDKRQVKKIVLKIPVEYYRK